MTRTVITNRLKLSVLLGFYNFISDLMITMVETEVTQIEMGVAMGVTSGQTGPVMTEGVVEMNGEWVWLTGGVE